MGKIEPGDIVTMKDGERYAILNMQHIHIEDEEATFCLTATTKEPIEFFIMKMKTFEDKPMMVIYDGKHYAEIIVRLLRL